MLYDYDDEEYNRISGVAEDLTFAIGRTRWIHSSTTVRFASIIGGTGDDSTESREQYVMPFDATIKSAYMDVNTNGKAGNTVYYLRVNGVNSAISFTYGNVETGQKETITDIAISKGDLINWEAAPSISGTVDIKSVALRVVPA